MSEKTLIQKADVINFTIIVFVVLVFIMAIVQIGLACMSKDPMTMLQDLRDWLIPLISGIFLSYGLTRKDQA